MCIAKFTCGHYYDDDGRETTLFSVNTLSSLCMCSKRGRGGKERVLGQGPFLSTDPGMKIILICGQKHKEAMQIYEADGPGAVVF